MKKKLLDFPIGFLLHSADEAVVYKYPNKNVGQSYKIAFMNYELMSVNAQNYKSFHSPLIIFRKKLDGMFCVVLTLKNKKITSILK